MIVQPRTAWGGKSHTRDDIDRAERESAPAVIKAIFGTPPINHEDRASVKTEYGDPTDVWLECEVAHPTSSRGRTVHVHIPAEQVLSVLKACKDAAAAQRDKALS